jgi:anti-anti-sigma factor
MWLQEARTHVQVLTWQHAPTQLGFPEAALRELDAVVGKKAKDRWVIDAHSIPLLTSEAIALLIGVVRKINLAGGHICLARPDANVATVLRMTRLTKILPLYETLDEAIAALVAL